MPSTPAPALQRLRGTADVAGELEELEEERVACQGQRTRRPWELFQDRGLRRQVTSLVVLGSAVELCGNDSVRTVFHSPLPGTGGCRLQAAGSLALCSLSPGVRIRLLSVPGGGDPRGEGPVRSLGDWELRAACSLPQCEFVMGLG